MRNVGQVDKWLRIIIGIILLAMFFFGQGNSYAFLIFGIIALYTGLTRNCMLYKILGINTCKDE
ncbi:MAG: YgaP family membrane protein [Bacillota bacterium]